MMSLFENRFGEYPFINEKYGHVEFGRGGEWNIRQYLAWVDIRNG